MDEQRVPLPRRVLLIFFWPILVLKRHMIVLVWPILILKVIAFITQVYSIYIMVTDQFTLPEGAPAAMVDFFESFGWVDHTTNFVVASLGLAGSIALILRRKIALPFFLVSFVLGVLLWIYQMNVNNFYEALGMRAVVGWVLGSLVVLAIIIYTKVLVKKEILT